MYIKLLTLFIFAILISHTSAYKIKTTEDKSRIKQVYNVSTPDNQEIILTRYANEKKPPIMFIHGIGGSHLMYDWNENHSLSRFNLVSNRITFI